jgi:hypothetical protein
MKTKILLTAIFTAISICGFSQYMERETVIQTNEKGTVQSVEFSSEDQEVTPNQQKSRLKCYCTKGKANTLPSE